MAKILHVIQILTLGGGARALLATAKCSMRQGDYRHTVVSILPPEERAVRLARESGLRVVAAPGPAELAAEIDAADIVQMHWWNVPEMTDFLRAKHPAMRLIGFYHVAGDSLPHIITPRLIDYVDMNVPCNPYTFYDNPTFREMQPEKKLGSVDLVYGAADLDRLDGLRFKPHKGFNVGYIGTIDFIKMHPDYVKMSAAISIPDVKFVVCGDGSLDLLRHQAAEAGARDRFEFRGYVEDVRSAIEEFDLYGYPLCEETYAGSELNLQEIMYAGLACVVFPYGGVKRLVVNDYTGLIVHSAREYKQAVEYLYHHPAERRRLGRNAKAYAEQIFGAENAARKINAVYNRLLERPKRLREWPAEADSGSTGADMFQATLGERFGEAYYASRKGGDLRALLDADDRIAASTRVGFISGVLAYRGKYPADPWLRYWCGLCFQKLGSFPEAALEFVEAVKYGFPHWRARWRLVQAAKAMGRGDLAQTVQSQLETQHPGYRKELEAAMDPSGTAQAEKPDWSAQPAVAPRAAEEVTSALPDPGGDEAIEAQVLRAEIVFQSGRGEESERILNAVLAKRPEHARALNNLGVIQFGAGRKEQAIATLVRAIRADRDYTDAFVNLFQALIESGKHEQALSIGYAALDKRPDNPTLLAAVAAVEEDWADKTLATSRIRDLNYRKRPYRITALVSTYKSADFMRECLDDLEAQTLARDLEIIVVDADSPQGEDAIVEEYQRRFDNIRYIRTRERIGIYPAWNLAIRAASGTFLTPMSTNDRLAPDAYEAMLAALDSHPEVDLVYGDSYLTNIAHETFGKHTPCPDYGGMFRWPDYDYEDLIANCRVGPHPVWRKSVHTEVGYFDGRYKAIADQDFWLRLALFKPLLHIAKFTGLAWLTKDSLSGQSSSFQEIISIHDKHAAAYVERTRAKLGPAGKIPSEAVPARAVGPVALLPAEVAVSAVVSAFDSEKFLRGCLEDLVEQTLFRRGGMEIIVVDSGSRQLERKIVEEFQAKHERIVYVRSKRETIYAAWNRAVLASRGRYLVNANADDRHRNDAFEIMAAELERGEASGGPGLVYADALLTKRENETFTSHTADRVWSLPDWSPRQALIDCPFGCTVMWRRSLHAKLGLFDESLKIAGDYEFFFRAALESGARHLAQALTLYYESESSLSYGGRNRVDDEVHGFLARYRRDLPLEKIYPFLETDASPQARAAAGTDLAMHLLDPLAGRVAPADAIARLERALDWENPNREILYDLFVASAAAKQSDLSRAYLVRLAALDPAFLISARSRNNPVVFRLSYPALDAMPAIVKVGDTRVPIAVYRGAMQEAAPAAKR